MSRIGRPIRLREHAGPILTLAGMGLLFAAFRGCSRGDIAPSPSETPGGNVAPVVFFTAPSPEETRVLQGGVDGYLVQAIDGAQYSVDVAVYHLNLWSIRDALIRAARRGLQVRVVVESDHGSEPEIAALIEAGIEVLGDRRDPLMHHKFVVLDRREVWTGSMNLTVGSVYDDDNNLLRLESAELAEDFTREFEEMFLEDRFGPLSLPDTPYPLVAWGEGSIEVWFSPDDGVARRIVELIRGARERVEFLAYTLTLDSVAEALAEKAEEGIPVRGVLDAGQAGSAGSDLERLRAAGVEVVLDGGRGNMHHKVILVDGLTVLTGSFNFTRSAEEYNDEAVLILHVPELADRFAQEFVRVWSGAGGD